MGFLTKSSLAVRPTRRAPQDPPVTTGVQSALVFKDSCIGNGQSLGYNTISDATFSEDCLGVSIQAPGTAFNTSRLPVLFYISGGGYSQLANVNYDFSEFITATGGNVVVVQLNYRVGALGFLAGSAVKAEGALNAGLLDQRKTLQWTKKYISAFGGDPNHIVILGGSAGAGSVALHLAAYGGRNDNLFVGAVADAVFSPQVNNASYSEYQYQTFASSAGCGAATDKLACLRASNINDIQKANIIGTYPGKSQTAEFAWTPVVDGNFLVDVPLAQFQQGKFVKVPLITGDITNEGTVFAYNAATPEDVSEFMSSNYPLLNNSTLAKINTLYPLMDPFPFHNAYFPSAAAAYGESTFTCPSTLIAQLMSSGGLPTQVHNYRFNQPTSLTTFLGFGVPHNIDLGAIFGGSVSPTRGIVTGALNIATFDSFNTGGENAAVKSIMMSYIISFVRHLDPNKAKNKSAPQWAPIISDGKAAENSIAKQWNSDGRNSKRSFISMPILDRFLPVTGN